MDVPDGILTTEELVSIMSIELKNVTYTYSPGTAPESQAAEGDVSLVIPDGQVIGDHRTQGSGKSAR